MSGGMSGVDLVHALHVHRPSLPVVLTSGFMASNVSSTGNPADMPETNDLDLPVLAKPYRQVDLARVIEQALDLRAGPSVGGGCLPRVALCVPISLWEHFKGRRPADVVRRR